MILREETTAGILTGGGSTRMGRCKALLPWGSGTLLTHAAARLAGFSEVLLSAAPNAALPTLGLRVVPDVRLEYGPLEGLYRLLLSSRTEWLFVCAVDLPLWDAALPALLLQSAEESTPAVVPRSEGRVHPLCALYHRSAIPALESLLAAGQHRVMALVDALPTRIVDLDAAGLSPAQLWNANTPDAYARCRAFAHRTEPI